MIVNRTMAVEGAASRGTPPMSFEVTQLITELKVLRKGRGIETPDIGARVGPMLRRAAGVQDGDGPVQIRRKVAMRLGELIERLPSDLRLATGAAFGLDPGARLRLYQERIEHVAAVLQRDPRTVQRRINEGIIRIAELALEQAAEPPEASTQPSARPPWRTIELQASVVLDLPLAEVIEIRRVAAEQDRLELVELSVTLTPPQGRNGAGETADLGVDILYGGVLTDRIMRSSSRIGFALRLPKPLNRNDEHEYALRIRIPLNQGMAPHYVCTPRYPCRLFRLHVRFGPGRAPNSIWRLHGTYPLELTDPASAREPISADPSGEVHVVFTDLEPNLSYGVAWNPTGDTPTRGVAELGDASLG